MASIGAEVGAEGSPDDCDGDGAGDDVLRTPVPDPAFPGRDGPGAPRRQAGSSDDDARPRARRTAEQREHNARMDRERRRAAATARRDDAVDKTLEWLHDASGSTITANSRRLRTLGDGDERARARRDVAADIGRYAEVPLETKAACVRDYAARDAPAMRVCGGCGLRDPREAYGDVQQVPATGALCTQVPKESGGRCRGCRGHRSCPISRR